MFLHLTQPTDTQTFEELADQALRMHPLEAHALMEAAHEFRVWDQSRELGHPDRRTDTPALPRHLIDLFNSSTNPFIQANRDLFRPGTDPVDGQPSTSPRNGRLRCSHWIYIYLIECTRCFQIFQRVLFEYRFDEKLLGTPLPAAQPGMRLFEDLFCSPPPVFGISHIVSSIRPDATAVRLNAYDRVLGLKLPFPDENGQPYRYHEASVANRDFMPTLYRFLEEIWILIANNSNASGSNPGDAAAAAAAADLLRSGMLPRYQHGNLAREQCYFACMFEFLQVVLAWNSPIIVSTRCEAATPEERLKRLGERVGIPSHHMSFYFFRIAESVGNLLTDIEAGVYNDPAAIQALYDPASPLEPQMRQIIEFLGNATGRNLKSRTQGVAINAPNSDPAMIPA